MVSGALQVPDLVHVVDDDAAVRDSLRYLLEATGFTVVTHETADACLAAAPALWGGCVLTDIRMPGLDGLELQQRLRQAGVHACVIVMTGHADVPLAVQAMKNGAVDFLEKPFEDEQLIAVVRRALEAGCALRDRAAASREAAARLATLTPREREVMDELVAGHGNKAIALLLGGSPRTVEVHRIRVMSKLGVHSLPELVRLTQTASG